jgi:DNA repair protein RadC
MSTPSQARTAPTIADWPLAVRPRERLIDLGPSVLSDAELVALLLGTGTLGRTALACAHTLLAELGGVSGLVRAEVGELARLPAVGWARAARLRAAVELGRRAVGARFSRGEALSSPAAVAERLRAAFAQEPQEVFVALGLDTKHRVLAHYEVARGTLTSVEVHPREVLRRLVRESAAAFIVAHNHPSGDPSPSPEDLLLTVRLASAGELLGIRLVDHVIVGHRATFSFAESTDVLRRWPSGSLAARRS